MSHNAAKGSPVSGIFKSLVVAFFRLAGLCVAFLFKIAGLVCAKLSEVFEKLSNNGRH